MGSNGLMKDILLSEIIEADVRAKRSMRVFQHQEGRIKTLEDEISQKCTSLEEVKQQHTELLEVHDYMKQVQELQRQLIKLQELEFLSHVSTPAESTSTTKTNTNANGFSNRSSIDVTESTSNLSSYRTNIENEMQTSLEELIAKKKKSQVLELTPLQQATFEKGKLLEAVKSKLSELGLGLNFRNDNDKNEELRKSQDSNYKEREDDDDDDDQDSKVDGSDDLRALRDRLSSHQRAISSLSNEVLVLRKEREELLSYMKDFLVSRTPTDTILKEADTMSGRFREDFRMKGDIKFDKISQTNIPSSTSSKPSPAPCRKSKDSHCHRKTKKRDNFSDEDTEPERRCPRKRSDLELRANRLWETACKFFTPEQAHFILTTRFPSDEMDTEDDREMD